MSGSKEIFLGRKFLLFRYIFVGKSRFGKPLHIYGREPGAGRAVQIIRKKRKEKKKKNVSSFSDEIRGDYRDIING